MGDEIWVEIFDCFYGDKSNQYDKVEEDSIPDEVKDIISKIQNLTDFEAEMGQPEDIIEYTEGNIHYSKKTWNKGDSKIVRIEASVIDGVKYDDLSLEEKIKIAEQNEDYEKAAKLKEEADNQDFIDELEK